MISVVVPTYNSGGFLRETVASVLAQTVREWELILVDDGSIDGTAERGQAWSLADPRIRFVQQDHQGANDARNLGLALCDSSCWAVAFLDHDDVWEPNALEVLGGRLAAHPDAVAAYGIAGYIDENGHRLGGGLEAWIRDRVEVTESGLVAVEPWRNTGFGVLALGNRIPTPGQVLIRPGALARAGGWDRAAFEAADYALWARLSLLGDFLFIDQRVIGWRQHSGNLSRQRRHMERSNLAARRLLASDQRLTQAQRRLVFKGYRLSQKSVTRLRLNWAWACFARGDLVASTKQMRHAAIAFWRLARGLGFHSTRSRIPRLMVARRSTTPDVMAHP